MKTVVLIIGVFIIGNLSALKREETGTEFYKPSFKRLKRQASVEEEVTVFDKNSETKTGRDSIQVKHRVKRVLDGAPVTPQIIRLRSDGKTKANEGRVEIYNNKAKKWGLICDDYWTIRDANVACRQLGFQKAAREATRQDHNGRGNWTDNDYVLDRIKCQGNEINILHCSHEIKHNCGGQSAGVSCIFNGGCPYKWIAFNGACYHVNVIPLTYKEAEKNCIDQGAKLAYVLQTPENNFLSNALYTQFPDINQAWTGGYFSEIKLDHGKVVRRWNWRSTIHNSDQWNMSNLWFQGFGSSKFNKRPIGDLEIRSCIALNKLYVDSQNSNTMFDVEYFWWDNLSCNEKHPSICQMNIPQKRTECYEGTGTAYRGTASRTNQGTACIKWSHPAVTVNPQTHPDAGLGNHNYCRNPDNDVMPWCWVNSELGVYGYCALTKCSEIVIVQTTTTPHSLSTEQIGLGQGGCPKNRFYCPSMVPYNRQCIPMVKMCDKVQDCFGGEDEDPQYCKKQFCTKDEFFCAADMFCILNSLICDGKSNCGDGADEKNCTKITELEILNKFTKFDFKILDLHEKVEYFNIPIEKCVDQCRIIYMQFPCKSFNFLPQNATRPYSLCQLLKQSQSENSTKLKEISYMGAHYSFKDNCDGQFKCRIGMCISNKKKCNGRNDCGDNSDESNCDSITYPPFEIRITGSSNEWEGRVEIRYEGEWGFICDDHFEINTAHVICKQLGFLEAIEPVHAAGIRFGKVRNPNILLDDLNCTGSEISIEDCPHEPWRKHNCKSEEIAGVVCKVDRACVNSEFRCLTDKLCIKMSQVCDGVKHCSDGEDEPGEKCRLKVKLVNGPDSFSGRVEIARAYSKGTVCDDNFEDEDATVICTMIGIPGRAEVVKDHRFGEGTGEIVLSNLRCKGNETDLIYCPSFKWGEHKCSHKEDVGIKCGLKDEKIMITSTPVANKRRDQVPGASCGKRPITQKRSRIVGGFETIYGAFPWQVGIRILFDDNQQHWCGGSILNDEWIISATHCFEYTKNEYLIRTGDWNNNVLDTYEQTFQIEELFLNPKYSSYDFDLALIKIKKKDGVGILFNDHVQPVCLANPGMVPDVRTKCLVSGWGKTLVETTEILLAAEVPLISSDRCDQFYKGKITDRMLCAGYEAGGIDSCQGDSGGPLVCQVNGIYTIFGATSWGDGCGVPKHPGVYAKISSMRDWVKEVTGF